MGLLKKYDPKKVVITWGSLILNSGIADGTFLTISREERNSSLSVGSDGRATMVINNNHSGTIQLTLRSGSDTNDSLTNIVLIDEIDNDFKTVSPLTIKDFTGRTLHTCDEVFLDGPPDDEFGNEESELVWTFMCHNLVMNARGSNEAS